jgi:uncharacterized protein YndB with AHSA1/START domain
MTATAEAAATADRELVITRIFDAPRELVFKAWTDPRRAQSWWGPRDYPATHLEMDVRPGGVWRGCLRSNETGKELFHGGVFREVAEPDRIVFTFAWEEAGERDLETLVTMTFAEQDGKTRMTGQGTRWASGRLDQHIRSSRRVFGKALGSAIC